MKNKFMLPYFGFNVKFNFKVEEGIEFYVQISSL